MATAMLAKRGSSTDSTSQLCGGLREYGRRGLGGAEGHRHAHADRLEALGRLSRLRERARRHLRQRGAEKQIPTANLLSVLAPLAQRGSSMSTITQLCEKAVADVSEEPKAIDMYTRIGSKLLGASVGFAGVLVDIYASGAPRSRSRRLTS